MTRDKDEPTYATAAAMAGVASEVESLRRQLEPLQALPSRVDQVSELVDQLAQQLQTRSAAPQPTGVRSWLMLPADAGEAGEVLGEVVAWLQQVLLRYSDAALALPECWVWHPDVVEELLWLMDAWLNAYQGPKASIALVGDWHDRQRPGVIKRIRAQAGNCSLENHTPATPPAGVPATDAVEVIADWWGERRDEPAPEPTGEQLNAAPRRRGGTRR